MTERADHTDHYDLTSTLSPRSSVPENSIFSDINYTHTCSASYTSRPWKTYIPLVSGILLPIATFLNIQSLTVPGWLVESSSPSVYGLGLNSGKSDMYPPMGVGSFGSSRCSPIVSRHSSLTAVNATNSVTLAFSILSAVFGVLAVAFLAGRMMEWKIKITTRSVIIFSFLQGVSTLLLAIFVHVPGAVRGNLAERIMEVVVYSSLSSALSFIVSGMLLYHHYCNLGQIYSYTAYELSPAQRQFILLTMAVLSYLLLMALAYASIELWDYDVALYWSISTITTIGYGDFTPNSTLGRMLLIPFSLIGITLVASLIWSSREVLLELLTMALISRYAKNLGINIVGDPSSSLLENRPRGRQHMRRFSFDEHLSRPSSITPPPNHRFRSSSNASSLHPPDSSSSSFMQPPIDNLGNRHSHRNSTIVNELSQQLPLRQKLIISRSKYLPKLIIESDSIQEGDIVDETRRMLKSQIIYASLAVLINIMVFGGLFALLEGWTYLQGLYFAYVTLSTIGFGDFYLCRFESRSILIWFILIGITNSTYLASMISEWAMDQWIVTIDHIERRVDRYERKAALKRRYGKAKKRGIVDQLFEGGRRDRRLLAPTTSSASSKGSDRDTIASASEEMHDSEPDETRPLLESGSEMGFGYGSEADPVSANHQICIPVPTVERERGSDAPSVTTGRVSILSSSLSVSYPDRSRRNLAWRRS